MSRIDASIVIPVYNDALTIGRCLESVLSQDYPTDRFEVIVVDNGSTDGSDRVAAQYPVSVLYETEMLTSYAARNRGTLAARGEIVLFTDADCLPQPGWLRAMVSALQDESVPAAGGSVEDAPADYTIARLIQDLLPMVNAQRLEGVYFPAIVGANAAYRRSILLKVGMFNATLFTGGDVDLSWRVQRLTKRPAIFVPQAVVVHDHRASLGGLVTRHRRYGYCSVLMSTMYMYDSNYPQDRKWHLKKTGAQLIALLTYLRSIMYRGLRLGLGRGTRYEALRPIVLLCAEWGALTGRLAGIWDTRGFRRVPTYSGRRGV